MPAASRHFFSASGSVHCTTVHLIQRDARSLPPQIPLRRERVKPARKTPDRRKKTVLKSLWVLLISALARYSNPRGCVGLESMAAALGLSEVAHSESSAVLSLTPSSEGLNLQWDQTYLRIGFLFGSLAGPVATEANSSGKTPGSVAMSRTDVPSPSSMAEDGIHRVKMQAQTQLRHQGQQPSQAERGSDGCASRTTASTTTLWPMLSRQDASRKLVQVTTWRDEVAKHGDASFCACSAPASPVAPAAALALPATCGLCSRPESHTPEDPFASNRPAQRDGDSDAGALEQRSHRPMAALRKIQGFIRRRRGARTGAEQVDSRDVQSGHEGEIFPARDATDMYHHEPLALPSVASGSSSSISVSSDDMLRFQQLAAKRRHRETSERLKRAQLMLDTACAAGTKQATAKAR